MDKFRTKLEELLKAIKQQKGIHAPFGSKGSSKAGWHVDMGNDVGGNAKANHFDDAKDAHRENLKDLKSMPKPKLTKDETCKYDPEKGMPESPVARPKASVKPMGANEKPVRASRHKTNTPTPEHKVGFGQEPAGPELPVRARWVGKNDSQWSLDKADEKPKEVKKPKKSKLEAPNPNPGQCTNKQDCQCFQCRQNR
jgi:hypothetical protein